MTTTRRASTAEDLAANSVAFVNQRRIENGLQPLQVDPALSDIADSWAERMASDGRLRHNPRLRRQVPSDYRAVGENIAYSSLGERIDAMWWDSSGHRANILGGSYSAVGIAFVQDGSGTYWAVQVFAGG